MNNVKDLLQSKELMHPHSYPIRNKATPRTLLHPLHSKGIPSKPYKKFPKPVHHFLTWTTPVLLSQVLC
nr:hypothetical protein Iba_chr08dCG14940 [Ipomoea batatas]